MTPRDLFTDPWRYAEFLPMGWERIQILDPLKIASERSQARLGYERMYTYEMHPEIRDWCREQFGYAPVVYERHRRPGEGQNLILNICWDNFYYSTVLCNPEHALAFTLRWL